MANGSSGVKKGGLSRDDVAELYTDVRKAMSQMKGGVKPGTTQPRKPAASAGTNVDAAKAIALEIKKAMARDGGAAKGSSNESPSSADNLSFSRFADVPPPSATARSSMVALALICLLGVAKLTISGIEALGILDAKPAMASASTDRSKGTFGAGYSREEVRVLQGLDARRVELVEQAKKLDERSRELDVRDREFTVRATQIKDLADKLKGDREHIEKRRDAQIEQLANVYSSMGPQEAAELLEQLDVAIALPLIERMPEKKIGQILGLMGRERALTLTKMLSASR